MIPWPSPRPAHGVDHHDAIVLDKKNGTAEWPAPGGAAQLYGQLVCGV